MIEAIDLGIISPIMIVFCGVLMVVLRAGASRVFFDVVGTFQAQRMTVSYTHLTLPTKA